MTAPCITPGDSSLTLDGVGELLCNSSTPGVSLLLNYDFGDPQQVIAQVQSLLLDGERVLQTRASNRTITLPLIVAGSDRSDMSTRMDALLKTVTESGYLLHWTPANGLEMVWDCFAATWQIHWDVIIENRLFKQQVDITIPALPYGRNPGYETVTTTPAGSVSSGKIFALSDICGTARAAAKTELQFNNVADSWLLHKPPADANNTAPIMTELVGNTVTLLDAAKLRGTYSIVVGVQTYNAPGQNRKIECTVEEAGTGEEVTIIKAYKSTLNLRPIVVGNLTLPLVERPPGSAISLTFTFVHSGGGLTGETALLCLMLLDTRGQTVASFDAFNGAFAKSAYIDEGDIGDPMGSIWNSSTALKADAYAAKELRVSGGPFGVFDEDNGNRIMVYSAGNADTTPTLTYRPHWLHERLPCGGGPVLI